MQTETISSKMSKDSEEVRMQDGLDEAQDAIKRGERVRLIYELLMENLGLTYENTLKDVQTALRDTQDAYNQGVKTIETIIKTTHKK